MFKFMKRKIAKKLDVYVNERVMSIINRYEHREDIVERINSLYDSKVFREEMLGGGVDAYNNKWELLNKCIELSRKEETERDIYLEFGVYTGNSINYIAKRVNKPVYGFDSFQGLPNDWREGFEKGTFKVDHLPKVERNVTLFKGWFHDSLKTFKCDSNRLALIHIDCDLYESAMCVFDMLAYKIAKGTVIVFDEFYNYPNWKQGEYKAFSEYVLKENINYKYIGYVKNDEQVAVVIE